MIIIDRKTKKEYSYEYGSFIKFLYNNKFGRILLKIFSSVFTARIVSSFMNSSLSKGYMKRKIKNNKIDMSLYEDKNYTNYNEFFTRKLKKLDINKDENVFISPCDSKLLIMKMDNDTKFSIKNSFYSAREIINDDIVNEYENGYALIFRLDVSDYHRYSFVDSGSRTDYKYINGILHTVQPIAYTKYPVFHQNCREWTILKTNNFGDIVETEIGAMMVGKICNHKTSTQFFKGEEKGYFMFGGSTIILFIKDNVVSFDKDILDNSSKLKETIVKCGERIGKKKD